MSRASAIVAIAVAFIAAMAVLSMRSAQHSASPSSSASQLARDDGARQELDQLRAELSALRQRVHEVEQAGAQPLAPAEGHVAEPDPGSQRASRLSPKEHDQLLVDLSKQLFEERLREEPRDVQWARGKEREIEASFAERYTSRLVSVSCGSTLCRTVVEHGKEEERKTFLETFFGDATFGGSCWFMRMGEGVGTELYCAREGQQLPRVDPQLLR